MTDMTAFERQLSREISTLMGPAPVVDDAAIFDFLTAARTPPWRFQSMFNATKFVVAGAIVALFGGFLLAGVLTQPSDKSLPAAASPTTTATPDLLPGVDLITEEVEPGVYRVTGDGTANDLAIHATVNGDVPVQVVAGQDGSLWVRDQPASHFLGGEVPAEQDGDDRLLRLGTPGIVDASGVNDFRPDISVAPDGTLWALGDRIGWPVYGNGSRQLLSLVDGEWTEHAAPQDRMLTGIETPADGSVWVSAAVGTGEGCPNGDVGRVAAGGRLAVARLVDGEWVEEAIEPALRAGDGGSLAVGPDGTALLGTTYFNSCHSGAWLGIVERAEDGWAPSFTADPEADRVLPGVGPIAIGSDGTTWAYQSLSNIGEGVPTWGPRLLRRTDGAWEILGDDESVPALVGTQTWESRMAVSPEGRLWIALDGPWVIDAHRDWDDRSIAATLDGLCAGLLSYDGTSWSQHLSGSCVSDVSAAPNGVVWATVLDFDPAWIDDLEPRLRDAAQMRPSPPAGIYAITPEAMAGTE